MCIWRAVCGEGMSVCHLARPSALPPVLLPPCWGRNGLKGRSWGGMTRNDEDKTALIIYRGSLSCWLDRWCYY